VTLESGLTIRMVSAPAFLAMKWDAYQNRGAGDLLRSDDVEDTVALVAGRDTIVTELESAPAAVREWVARTTWEPATSSTHRGSPPGESPFPASQAPATVGWCVTGNVTAGSGVSLPSISQSASALPLRGR